MAHKVQTKIVPQYADTDMMGVEKYKRCNFNASIALKPLPLMDLSGFSLLPVMS